MQKILIVEEDEKLRNKLEELDLKELIETKRGQGYILKGENWYEFKKFCKR